MSDEMSRLRRLLLFDAVCREGGISPAAAAVGLSQPAVSLAIKKLEQGFGSSLFNRGYGGSDLTAEGKLLHRRVRRMLEQMEDAVGELLGSDSPRSSSIAAICRHLTDAQIRCHLAIAQCGSAAGAARQLAISQPAVHRAAREMEDTVGVPLYRRRVHSVTVNAAGMEFARRLNLALHEIKQAADDLSAARGMLKGRISVGILPLVPQRMLARVVGGMLEMYPDAAITIREGQYALLLNDLRFGVIDVIVGALRNSTPDGAVVESGLFDDPYAAAVRRGHPLARRARITAADLADYDWVAPQKDMPRRATVEKMLDTLPHPPRRVIETSSLAMMMAMLVESDCITLLSRSHILHGIHGEDLVALNVPIPEARRTVGVTTRADWLPTPVQHAFLGNLRKQASRISGATSATSSERKAEGKVPAPQRKSRKP
jgi:DNA-binding transcriptional LysR family regulator